MRRRPSNGPRNVSARRAAAADVGALVALMRDFYAEADYVLDLRWAGESFQDLLANPALGSVWMAHLGIEAVGHAVLTVRYTMEYGALSGYVDDLYVKPPFRRIGAGTASLDELVAECRERGCKSMQVEVAAGNAPARALHGNFGLLSADDGRVLMSGGIPHLGT